LANNKPYSYDQEAPPLCNSLLHSALRSPSSKFRVAVQEKAEKAAAGSKKTEKIEEGDKREGSVDKTNEKKDRGRQERVPAK
jgi:hypothetical protein